jgi:hypothetical protein
VRGNREGRQGAVVSAADPAGLEPSCRSQLYDRCTTIQLNPVAEGGAMAINVDVDDQRDGMAQVRLGLFDV